MDTFTWSVVAGLALIQVRNYLAFVWRARALTEAAALALEAVYSGRPWEHFYAACPGYFALFFDLSQWRYVSPFKAE